MMIAEIPRREWERFSGVFRCRRPRQREARPLGQIGQAGQTGQGGKIIPFLAFDMEDISGEIPAFLWGKAANVNLPDLGIIQASGWLIYRDRWFAHITAAHAVADDAVPNPIQLLPRSLCPRPAAAESLHRMTMNFEAHPLSRFMESVFRDDAIALPFASAPASISHHHSYPGGLAEHSIECARMLYLMPGFTPEMRRLGIVAALFHDIGKIRTLKPGLEHGGTARTTESYVIGHDLLTLEILAPHLRLLDREWPDGATALRYIWTWRLVKHISPTPLFALAEAVAAADRISAGLSAEAMAFADAPRWKRFANLNGRQRFWRPRE